MVIDDEFYKQFSDIQKELTEYRRHNKDVFRGKTIFLPSADAELSEFAQFFILNFGRYGIKRLIGTTYNQGKFGSKFDIRSQIDLSELVVDSMEGDGNFYSDEVLQLRTDADMIFCTPRHIEQFRRS
jgi:hypothetical protein